MIKKKKRVVVTVAMLREKLGQEPKDVIIKLLKETQSPAKTRIRLQELTGLPIDTNRLNYLRRELRIDGKGKIVMDGLQ